MDNISVLLVPATVDSNKEGNYQGEEAVISWDDSKWRACEGKR